MGALLGEKAKIKKASTLSGSQQELEDLIRQGLESGEGPFKDIFGEFNEGNFQKEVANPAIQNFKENILPGLQEQILGGGHSTRGSAFRRGSFKAANDFQGQLAQMMYQARQDQANRRAGGLNTLYGRQSVENIVQPATTGIVQSFAQGAGNAIGEAGGAALTGGASTAFNAIKKAVGGAGTTNTAGTP